MRNTAAVLDEGASGVLSGPRLERLEQAVEGLSGPQLNWASGYLAGLGASREAAPEGHPQAETTPAITILYATQGGNARSIAENLARAAGGRGYAARVVSVDAYRVRDLAKEKLLVAVISTQGEGEPPEGARELFRFLNGKKPPRLDGLRYAVFGLGDSSYEFFCQAGRDLDELLRRHGASGLLERVDADVDFQAQTADWYDRVLSEVEQILPAAEAEIIQLPRHAATIDRSPQVHDRNHPLIAEVADLRRITTADALSGVHHLSLAIDPQALSYRPGDAIGVWFRNDPALVEEVLRRTGLSGEQRVDLRGQTQTLTEALARRLELTQLHPSVVGAWAERSGDRELLELSRDHRGLRCFAGERQFVDLLRDHPAEIDAAGLARLLRPLKPRLYSVASSQSVYEDEVHLTVSHLQYRVDGQRRQGGASGYLTQRLEPGDEVPIYLAGNPGFHLPEDGETPVILVGAGTGIAPFRAFLQERGARGDRGPNWLVFGNRHFRRDFLYQNDWLGYREAGLLQRVSLAFSRDAAERVYVQDRLREEGAELFRWLSDGARLYVCGGLPMERAVAETLQAVARAYGGMGEDDAEQFIEDLRAQGRYLRDVY